MAGKLVKRTLDIIKSGVDEKVKDYTSNWTQFTSDAREVKDILIKGETNAADTVQKLKRTGITKKISDWFYGAETEFESSGSDSDFDPGFSVESASDGKLDGDKSSSALTYDSMKDLSAKQTGMMVKIGRRQTEQSVANTAEVISTINNRTAEMVAVMNNINTSLKGVNDRLDKLIKIQSLGIEAEEERALGGEGGLYDSNGMLSLKGVFDAARTTGSGKFGEALQALGMAKGNIGPEMLFGLALDSVLGRQRSSLGGKSVNELGKEFNEFIGNGIQTALTNVISSKIFKDLFGDITGFEADKNYGDLRNARYDTKRAQFDNMTRHSIVKIMPELLIKLNENLSGKSYHINQNGDIVEGPAKNYFNEAVNGAISGHNIKSNIMTNIGQGAQKVFGKSIPQEDLDKAADALVRYYVYMMHSSQTYGGRMLTKADISNPSMTVDAIGGACEMLGAVNSDPSKGYDYWSKVCQTILYKVANSNSMDANAFVNNINQSIRNMQQSASEFGRNSFYSGQAGKITSQILTTGFVERYGSDAQKNQISRSTTTTASKFTTADYVKGIFALLNRGINVKLEGKGTYRKLTEADVKKEPWLIQSTNDEAAARLFGALTGDKNAIKGSMESALGLLGTANNATGGRVGVLQTAANLTTMFNQGKGFFDNIRNKQLTQNLVAAIHGDASALQAQVGGKFDQAKNAVVNNLPYGMTHDQRFIDAGHSIQGIGHNIVGHAQNLGHNIADKGRGFVQNTGVGQTLYRGVNNAMYDLDDKRLNAARNSLANFNSSGLSANDQRRATIASNAFEAGDMDKFNRAIGGITDAQARDYLSGKYDIISTIDARRTNVQGTPDIGAVRMAAPDKASKEHSKMYNLVKGGFNITAKALGAIAKIVRSGLEDVYYGFGSAIQGMFGGPRRNQQTGKMELHRGLIGDLTWGTMKTGAHYTKKLLTGIASLPGKAINAWNNGETDYYNAEEDRNYTRGELRAINRQAKREARDNEKTNRLGYVKNGQYVGEEYVEGAERLYLTRAQNRERKNAKVISQRGDSVVTRGDFVEAPLKSLGKTITNVIGKMGDFGKKIVEITKKIGGMIAKPFKFAADLFKKSSFGKGFFEGFGKAKEARNARKLEKERNSSFSNSAIGTVMDVLTGKTKDGPLERICDILDTIKTNTTPKTESSTETTNNSNGSNVASGDGSGWNTSGDTGGININNPSEQEGDPESYNGGTETRTKKRGFSAVKEKVGGAVNKFKGTEAGKLVTGTLENMGKVVGGMAQGVMGILKIAMGVLTAMEGFKAIQTLVEDIFKKGLKPLNQVFQKVYHMIKPLATQLTNIVKEIAKALTQMLDGVLKTLTPLLKMISDAISTIFETVLQPVMEILDATLSACMVPITLCLDAMKPALDIICNDLKIVSGVVQMGMGGIMGLLGGIGKGIGFLVSGVGHILKKFSRKAGSRLVETGEQVSDAADGMLENAKSLVVNGAKQFKEGLAGQLTVVKKLVTLEYLDNEEEEKKETVVDEERASKINLSDAGANFGSGDVNNYNTWNYTYGSGNTMNQHTYGPTMNMAERGCGPVALADAYMRRTGSGMSPLTLAGAMMGNGSYEPNRGTSVASMVNTGRALGMNMQLGGVTQRSLNGASPSNPITIMGSGSGFGTKRGNDHYLNVVGSDGRGNSYVSNPLNGRVSKTPTSQLALNSRLGLYGSGDKLPDEFGIDLDSMTALERLQSLSERFQKIFTGDSTVDKTKKEIEAGKSANMANTLDAQLGDITEEELKQLRDDAMDQYFKEHKFRAKRDGESDKEYEAALNAEFDKNGVDYFNEYKKNYIYNRNKGYKDAADSTDFAKAYEDAYGDNGTYNTIKKVMSDNSLSDDIESEGGSSSSKGGVGTFMSEKGVPLFNYGTPKYTDIKITDWMDKSTHMSGHSPLHDFFGQMNDSVAYSADDNWYDGDCDPDDTGTGQRLSSWRQANGEKGHGGLDINWTDGSADKKAYATTGGKVVQSGYSDTAGNNIIWEDSEGMRHWYMHLRDTPLASNGQTIEGGDLLGYVGNTGASGGAHLHYTISNDTNWSSDMIGEVNPIMYFSHFNPAAGSMAGDTMLQKMWSYLLGRGYSKEAIAGYLGFIAGESGGVSNGTSDINDINFEQGLGALFYYTGSPELKSLSAKMRESNEAYLSNINDYTKLAYSTWGGSPAGTKGSDGTYYGDTGLSQWVADSALGLINRAKDNGAIWTDAATQIQHFEEKQMAPLKSRFANAKSLRDAFEISGAYNAHSGYGWNQYDGQDDAKYGMRFKTAQAIYDAFKDADITQWTGYQAKTLSDTAVKTSHTTRNRYTAAINGKEVDFSDIRYRKDAYIYYYQESIASPGCNEARAYSEFARRIRGIEKLAPFITGDTKTLVTEDVITEYAIKQVGEFVPPTVKLEAGAPGSAQTEADKHATAVAKAAYEAKVADEVARCKKELMATPYMWAAINSSNWEFLEDTNVGSEKVAGEDNKGLTGIVNTQSDPLNLREEPNTTSKVLATIASGISIPITKTDDDNWYGTSYNNQNGYVSSKYISLIGGENSIGVAADHSYANVGNDNSVITVPKSEKSDSTGNKNDQRKSDYINNILYAKNIRDAIKSGAIKEKYQLSDNMLERLYNFEKDKYRDLNYDGFIGDPEVYEEAKMFGKTKFIVDRPDETGSTWNPAKNLDIGNEYDIKYQVLSKIMNYFDDENGFGVNRTYIYPTSSNPRTMVQMVHGAREGGPGSQTPVLRQDSNDFLSKWGWVENGNATFINPGALAMGSGDVPALDMNQIFDDASQTMQNATNAFTGGTTVVVTRDDQSTADMITKLSEITFKVRNERVEELLEELVDYVKTTKKKSSTFNHVHGSNNYTIEDMFDDEIPEGVVRLSKGG